MDSWGTMLTGWAVVLAVLALYAGWLLLRARVMARELHLGEVETTPATPDSVTADPERGS